MKSNNNFQFSDRWKDFLLQSILIVFSVILALFLNELRTNQKTQNETQLALGNVIKEIKDNYRSLEYVKGYHKRGMNRIDSIIGEAQQSGTPLSEPLFNLFRIALPNGILPPNTQRSAWNCMNSTGLLTELSYDQLYTLTRIYNLQAEGVETTWRSVANHLMSIETLDESKKQVNLQLLSMLFSELYQQEIYLMEKMEGALEKLGVSQ